MLYYHGTDVSEECDPAKSNNSKQCTACHYFHDIFVRENDKFYPQIFLEE